MAITTAKCFRVLQQTIKGSALCILLVILLIQSSRCLEKYWSDPTFISTHIVDQSRAELPAITACPDEGAYKTEVLQAHGIPSVKRYNYKRNLTWSSNQTGVTERDLFRLVTWEVDEFVQYVYVRTFLSDSATGLAHLKPDVSLDGGEFREQRHRSFGRCYTFHPRKEARERGIYYIKMRFATNAKLYIHRKGQFLDLNGRMGYKVKVNEQFQAQVSYEDVKMLPKSGHGQRSSSKSGVTCADCVYDDCMYGTVADIMRRRHNCTAPWVMSAGAGASVICSDPLSVNGTFWIAWTRITNQRRDCLVPCHSLMVSVSAKNTRDLQNKNYSEAYLYFPPRVMLSEENDFYTFLSLMAEIGGYTGLLLGISLFHLAGWLSKLLDKQIKKYEEEEEKEEERRRSREDEPGERSREAAAADSNSRKNNNSHNGGKRINSSRNSNSGSSSSSLRKAAVSPSEQ